MRTTQRIAALAFWVVALGWPLPAGDIRLKTRTLDPRAPAAPLSAIKRRVPGRSHYVLRFRTPLTASAREALAARGIRVTSYLSDTAVAVAARDEAAFAGLNLAATQRLAAADKISPLAALEDHAAYLVEFHADVERPDARALISEAGLEILNHPDLLPSQLLVAGDWRRIASLAEWDEVAYIFPASADLVAGNHVMACPGAVTEEGAAAQYVKVSVGWGAGALHYFFNNTSAGLDPWLVESEVVRAFREWARYAPLEFTAAADGAAARTISILFARGAHGDGYPFDGPGKVLAHTFYPAPPNSEPLAGDMHLDADESWRVGATVDLFTVALHEAGHALGLGHSDRPGSVMYPYYRFTTGLTADDIAGIQEIYGSRDAPPPPEDPAVPPTQPAPALNLVVLSPAATATTTAATVAVSGRVENAAGTVVVSWQSDRGGSGNASGGAAWSIPALPLGLGANAISLTAADGAGKRAARRIVVTRTAANSPPGANPPAGNGAPPALRITSPAFTIISTSLPRITLSGTASESSAVVRWTSSTGGAGNAAGTASWVAADIPLYRGNNIVTVRAFDAAGNSSWRSVTVVRR